MSNRYKGAGVSPKAFQGIIRERKAEVKGKAEEKRLADLKRIQEMKSREGKNPLEVFPKEIWELILEQLNPEDRKNIWELHQAFCDIMGNTRLRDDLFPLILQFSVDEFWDPDYENMFERNYFDSDDQEEPEVIKPMAPLTDYLEMRRVSKSLRKGVDRFFEENLLLRLRTWDDGKPRKTVTIKFDDFSYSDIKKLDEIIIFFESNPSLQRFITRSFTVIMNVSIASSTDAGGRSKVLKKKITRLLQLTGEHIWHFNVATKMCICPCTSNNGNLYLAFIEWLSLLPNLKWLQLSLYCTKTCKDCIDVQLLRDHPPPKLTNLERMDFSIPPPYGAISSECRSAKQAICNAILQANPQVTNLHLSTGAHSVLSSTSVQSLRLETLGLGSPRPVFSLFEFGPKVEHTIPIMEIRNVINISTNTHSWSFLKRLNLRVDLRNESMASLFQFLQKLPTLEELSLDVKNVTIGGVMDFLMLPNLKDFNFRFDPATIDYSNAPGIHFFFSLQFLLHAKNLRKIYWYQTSDYEELEEYLEESQSRKNKNMLDFGGGWGDLSKSNLWQIFPSLEEVGVNQREAEKNEWDDMGEVEKWREYRHRQLSFVVRNPV